MRGRVRGLRWRGSESNLAEVWKEWWWYRTEVSENSKYDRDQIFNGLNFSSANIASDLT